MGDIKSFPKILMLRQSFPNDRITDLEHEVRLAVEACIQQAPLHPGAKVAITVGSRGIRHITDMLRYTIQVLKSYGYEPYLISAMGSHGGGKRSGQAAILDSLGITEAAMDAPVIASDDTLLLGVTSKNHVAPAYAELCKIEQLQVYVAREAIEADAVLVMNRIKPHTAFHGDYESGLMKMLAVGLGRAPGADSVHRLGANLLADAIPSIAAYILSHAPIWGGLAIVENGYDEPVHIQGMPAPLIPQVEKELLLMAKSLMPAIPITGIDLCLIGEMGKNFSGTGVDTNVIGRMKINGVPEPAEPGIRYLGILGISEPSHGNATGIGLADFTTQRVVEEIDWQATYLNCLTSGFTARAATPIIAKSDIDLVEKAIFALKTEDLQQLRLVILRNTLQLDELWVTESLFEELRDREEITAVGDPFPLEFDSEGSLMLFAPPSPSGEKEETH